MPDTITGYPDAAALADADRTVVIQSGNSRRSALSLWWTWIQGKIAVGAAGVSTINLTGGQIKFPATAVPSADANTLDDYEEGTFTPTISFGGASVGVTYATQLGAYNKIGRTVWFLGSLILTSNGSSTGVASINGLPFAVAVVTGPTQFVGNAGFASLSSPIALSTGSAVEPYNAGATGITQLTEANFTDSANCRFGGFYVIS